MVQRIGMPEGFEDKINEALRNKRPCPAQKKNALQNGWGTAAYCVYGACLECEYKSGIVVLDSGILCEVDEQYSCDYRPTNFAPDFSNVDVNRITEDQLKCLGVESVDEYIRFRLMNFIHANGKEIARQARADIESEVPRVPIFDDFMKTLEEECGPAHKETYRDCRNRFYHSGLADIMVIEHE